MIYNNYYLTESSTSQNKKKFRDFVVSLGLNYRLDTFHHLRHKI